MCFHTHADTFTFPTLVFVILSALTVVNPSELCSEFSCSACSVSKPLFIQWKMHNERAAETDAARASVESLQQELGEQCRRRTGEGHDPD